MPIKDTSPSTTDVPEAPMVTGNQAEKKGNQNTGHKIARGTSTALKEISGITFLTRGVAANLRALVSGKNLLRQASTDLLKTGSKMHSDPDSYKAVVDMSVTERQINLVNALLMIFLIVSGILAAFIALPTIMFSQSGELFTSFFSKAPITHFFSIAISILGVAFIAVYGYCTIKDFGLLYACTKPPNDLVKQYHASYYNILTLALLHSGISTLFQLLPFSGTTPTVFEIAIRISIGIVVITCSVGVYKSLRNIFSPTMPAYVSPSIFRVITKNLCGFSVARSIPDNTYITTPYVPTAITILACIAALLTKNMGLISLFSTLVTITCIAFVLTTFCLGWFLDNDRSSTN